MKAVVQRVTSASVTIEGVRTATIAHGLVVLLGITHHDTPIEAEWMARKVVELRVFPDEAGRLNQSVLDVQGAVLAVSQFTLYGDLRKGTRPSFIQAAPSEVALPLYEHFVSALKQKTPNVATGTFGAMMDVALVNNGPVTILLEREPTA